MCDKHLRNMHSPTSKKEPSYTVLICIFQALSLCHQPWPGNPAADEQASLLSHIPCHSACTTYSHRSRAKRPPPFAILLLWQRSWCGSACGCIAALQNSIENVCCLLRKLREVKVLIFFQAKNLILSASIYSDIISSLLFFSKWLGEILLFPISFLYNFT